MSKLAHSNDETMRQIEEAARNERPVNDEPDQPIDEAEARIRQLATELTRRLRTRWPRGSVQIWVTAAGATVALSRESGPFDAASQFQYGASVADAAHKTFLLIAEMPDPRACDPWFDPAHPLNQTSEAT